LPLNAATCGLNPCASQIHHPSFFVGIILRNAKLPAPNHGHVVLAKPSPILFYPISSTEVRYAGQDWTFCQPCGLLISESSAITGFLYHDVNAGV
jgi:hypothetical protein